MFGEKWKNVNFCFEYTNTSVTSNDIHLIYLPKEDTYRSAKEIYNLWKSGEKITLLDANKKLVSLNHMTVKREKVPLYNLHVDGIYDEGGIRDYHKPNHNYFANGILVHNEKASDPDGLVQAAYIAKC